MKRTLQLIAVSAVMVMSLLPGGANAAVEQDNPNAAQDQVHRPRDPYTDGGLTMQSVSSDSARANVRNPGSHSVSWDKTATDS